MPDGVERKIARMVVRDGMSHGEANAAMRLISIMADAGEAGGGAPGMAHIYSDPARISHASVNHRELRAIRCIAGHQLLRRWRDAMAARGDDPSPTVAVLILGEAFSTIDRREKRRKGWARRQVRMGIETFHEVLREGNRETKLDKSGQKGYQIG